MLLINIRSWPCMNVTQLEVIVRAARDRHSLTITWTDPKFHQYRAGMWNGQRVRWGPTTSGVYVNATPTTCEAEDKTCNSSEPRVSHLQHIHSRKKLSSMWHASSTRRNIFNTWIFKHCSTCMIEWSTHPQNTTKPNQTPQLLIHHHVIGWTEAWRG